MQSSAVSAPAPRRSSSHPAALATRSRCCRLRSALLTLILTLILLHYLLQAIEKLRKEELRYVDVRQEVQDRYNAGIQGRMKYMSWSSGCNSWYLSDDGSNHSLYPGFASEYVLRARTFRPSEYEIARF